MTQLQKKYTKPQARDKSQEGSGLNESIPPPSLRVPAQPGMTESGATHLAGSQPQTGLRAAVGRGLQLGWSPPQHAPPADTALTGGRGGRSRPAQAELASFWGVGGEGFWGVGAPSPPVLGTLCCGQPLWDELGPHPTPHTPPPFPDGRKDQSCNSRWQTRPVLPGTKGSP